MAAKNSSSTIFWVICLLLVVAAAAYLLYPVKKELRGKQDQLRTVQEELHRLRKEQNRQQQENQALKTSPAAVERVAREEFKMVRPGEAVIYYPKDAKKKWQERQEAEKSVRPN